jgi:hypothetical protein
MITRDGNWLLSVALVAVCEETPWINARRST